MPRLILYYREGCHLCEVMLQALRGLQPRLGFALQLVDVHAASGPPNDVENLDDPSVERQDAAH